MAALRILSALAVVALLLLGFGMLAVVLLARIVEWVASCL